MKYRMLYHASHIRFLGSDPLVTHLPLRFNIVPQLSYQNVFVCAEY